MIDEMFDRSYQAGRDQLNGTILSGLSRLGTAVANAFSVLNRIEYDAPWSAKVRHVR